MSVDNFAENSEGRRAIFPAADESKFPEYWRVVHRSVARRFHGDQFGIDLVIVEGDNRFPEWVRGATGPYKFNSVNWFFQHLETIP